MNVGFIGLGKLGLPVASAMAARGLNVYGYDLHEPDVEGAKAHEEGFTELLEQARGRLAFTSLAEVVERCEVVFCAVQTPHEPRFEGVTSLPADRADFDYTYLVDAAKGFAHECERQGVRRTLSVISTVLPGTMHSKVIPAMGTPNVSLVYNPSFIAMGTTIRDFLDPEFVLIGGALLPARRVIEVYDEVLGSYAVKQTTVPNAELIKVAYNTFIGLKLAFANTLMEVCHKTDCDVDEVTGALKLAHRRLISGAYLDGGMGDGGGCHPRDNIALSWLARELDLSYDLFEAAMLQREKQAEWLADLMCQYDLPKGILGIAYKPSSHLTAGSPAKLVASLLNERGEGAIEYDPHVGDTLWPGWKVGGHQLVPHVWLVGCKHPEFPNLKLPEGSVVIDPWRYMPDQEGVQVVRLGEAAGGRGELLAPERGAESLGQRAA